MLPWKLRTVVSLTLTLVLFVATAGAQKIYWTDDQKIQRCNLDGTNIEDVLAGNGLTDPFGVAIDVNSGKIYWTSQSPPKIHRANLDGSNVEDLVTAGLVRPLGIALDLSAKKMYWADGAWNTNPGKIQRADLDGTNVQTLVVADAPAPAGIALDVGAGKMYWTDWRTGKILRANLDGSAVENLITAGLTVPSGIVLDLVAKKMYWTDDTGQWKPGRIGRANLDGSNAEDIITQGITQPKGIAIDPTEGKLYWVDGAFVARKIQRANVDGSNLEDVVSEGLWYPWGIALDTDAGKIYFTDRGTDTIKRADLTGSNVEDLFKRDVDTPRAITLNPASRIMYWYNRSRPYHGPQTISRASFDGENIVNIASDCLAQDEISLDPLRNMMYWFNSCGRMVMTRFELDRSSMVDIVTQGSLENALTKVAIDVSTGKVYWSTALYFGGEVIRRANLDGNDVEDLLTIDNAFSVGGMAIDSWAGKMYWTDTEARIKYVGRIHRANLDGSQLEDLVLTGLVRPLAITLDPSEGKMYWVDQLTGKIQRANLDGTQVEDLVSGLTSPYGLALDLCGRASTVALSDHAIFVECMTGSSNTLSTGCHCADLSGDGRADLIDFAIFQAALAPPNRK